MCKLCRDNRILVARRVGAYLANIPARGNQVSDTEALFGVLRQSADAGCAAAIEGAVANAQDHELCRVNALAFATKNKLDEERTIAPPSD